MDKVKLMERINLVQSKKISDRRTNTIDIDKNKAIVNIEFIKELIE